VIQQTEFEWIQRWYAAQCNGEWEHRYGVKLETLDNPGWMLEIDLVGTSLERVGFERQAIDTSAQDWYNCAVEGGVFRAAAGTESLERVLAVFRNWATTDHGSILEG